MTDKTNPIDALHAGRAFAFSRWGDGEWNAVLGLRPESKANCDGHHYFDSLGGALRSVLSRQPDYTLGMQPLAARLYSDAIAEYLAIDGLALADFVDGDIWHKQAQRGQWAFRHGFARGRHMMIGPAHLRAVFPAAEFLEIPARDCWLATSETLARAASALQVGGFARVGFCASMAANVWIDVLRNSQPRHAYIDFGSVFDPLAGVKSREYMRNG